MKMYIKEFTKRGMMASAGGPIILAIVYYSLGASGAVTSFTPSEVCKGILSVILMAFVAGGISVVYSVEKLPFLHATMIHAIALYADYLLVYLTNEWIPRDVAGIGVFTLIYIGGYAVIWLCVIMCIKVRVRRLNRIMKGERG